MQHRSFCRNLSLAPLKFLVEHDLDPSIKHNVGGRVSAPINVKPGGGGRQGFDQSLLPWGRHLNYLAVPGVEIFELLFVPVHKLYPRVGNSVI